jgi:hypothetical protein
LIGAALGYHLHLRANRTVKVRGLPEGVNPEFFNAFNRSGHDTGSHTVSLGSGGTGKIHRVAYLVPGHIVRVLSAIDRKTVLVSDRTCDLARRSHSGL